MAKMRDSRDPFGFAEILVRAKVEIRDVGVSGNWTTDRIEVIGNHLIVHLPKAKLLVGPKALTARLNESYGFIPNRESDDSTVPIKLTAGRVQIGHEIFGKSQGVTYSWYFHSEYLEDKGKSAQAERPVILATFLREGEYPGDVVEEDDSQTSQERTMHEINIAALMRKDTYTVGVIHAGPAGGQKGGLLNRDTPEGAQKAYTYVTNIPGLVVGDTVVVKNIFGLVVAEVTEVDEGLKIDPGTNVKVAWVLSKVDMAAVKLVEEENAQIEDTFAQAYQQSLRRSFRDRILGDLTPEALALLPNSVK